MSDNPINAALEGEVVEHDDAPGAYVLVMVKQPEENVAEVNINTEGFENREDIIMILRKVLDSLESGEI